LQKVQVLLSTYNGVKFLRPLMDSLLDQDYPRVEILVRDDGSTDDTTNVLQESSTLPNVKIFHGQHIGAVRSFFKLLELSSSQAAYFAFCDQDDIWKKDKISHAIEMLSTQRNHRPLLYCGRLKIVDEHLYFRGLSKIPSREPSFKNAIVENVADGCTAVFNAHVRDLIIRSIPHSALMHDWWLYLVVSAFGNIVYDEEPKILYRQHSDNLIGNPLGFKDIWAARIQRFKKNRNLQLIHKQAEEFDRIYGSYLDNNVKRTIHDFINRRRSFISRIKYAFWGDVYRQSMIDNVILKLLIALNYI